MSKKKKKTDLPNNKTMILQVYNQEKCKETYLSVKKNCPKELEFIFQRENTCDDDISPSQNFAVIQWFNKFDLDIKFYFITHIIDNPPNLNPYSSYKSETSFNMDVFRSIYTSDKILLQIFEHCNKWKNNEYTKKTKDTMTEEFLCHTLDYFNYSKEQLEQQKQNAVIEDDIKTNTNTTFNTDFIYHCK